MSGAHDSGDLLAHIKFVARDERADVDDHVQLACAALQREPRLEHLGFGTRAAVRESDHRADRNLGVRQEAMRALDIARPNADRRDVIVGGELAPCLDR